MTPFPGSLQAQMAMIPQEELYIQSLKGSLSSMIPVFTNLACWAVIFISRLGISVANSARVVVSITAFGYWLIRQTFSVVHRNTRIALLGIMWDNALLIFLFLGLFPTFSPSSLLHIDGPWAVLVPLYVFYFACKVFLNEFECCYACHSFFMLLHSSQLPVSYQGVLHIFMICVWPPKARDFEICLFHGLLLFFLPRKCYYSTGLSI